MGRDTRQECLNVIARRIRREEDTLKHLRRTYPPGGENEQAIRLLIKYLHEVENEILAEVPP